MVSIKLDPQGDRVAMNLTRFLGPELFARYLSICHDVGTRYERANRVNYAPVDAVPALLAAFRRQEIAVEVDRNVRDALEHAAAEAKALLQAGRERVELARKQLAPRGLALYRFQETGVEWLAPRKRALLADEMGLGKQQPVDTLVATASGWKMIGNLSVGDSVIGSNGEPTRVTGVFPQGVKPSYSVSFSDGSSVEAGPEHLWTMQYRKGGREWASLVLTTEQLRERPVVGNLDLSKTTLYLPMLSSPVVYESKPVPIGGYTMGMLISNGYLTGSSASVTVNSADANCVIRRMGRLEQMQIGSVKTYDNATRISILGIIEHVRSLGLSVPSPEKHIPRSYMRSEILTRKALLQGLMDGDGSVTRGSKKSSLTYHTTSMDLAICVRELVESLGGIASVRSYDRSEEGKLTDYQIRMRLPLGVEPFSTPRKSDCYMRTTSTQPCRTLLGVEYIRDVESVCIQVQASDNLYATERFILTHNTVQALLSLPEKAGALVICPASVRENWVREAARWRPDLWPGIIPSKIRFRWPSGGQLLVATYGTLPAEHYLEAMGPPPGRHIYLIGDEAHSVKNPKAARTQRFRKVAKVLIDNGCGVWLLTGTPLLNRPPELWAVLEGAQMGSEAFGSWTGFVEMFRGHRGRYGYEWGQPIAEAPDRLRRVSLHRRRIDVLPDLPTKTRKDIICNGLDSETASLCDSVMAKLKIDWEAEQRVTRATKMTRTAFTELSRARAALATSKIPRMLEIVEEYEQNEEPVVVFSVHRKPIEALALRPGWGVITGETPAEDRGRIVRAFQDGHLKGIGGTIRAMGVGLTLTHSAHALFVDLDWTPALNQQAEDRICRIGQDRGVIVTRMVSDHRLDLRVLELLTAKQELIEATVEASAVEAEHVHASPAEDLFTAAQSAADVAVDMDARAAEIEKKRVEEDAAAVRTKIEELREAGVEYDGRPLEVRGKTRSAANDVEARSAAALVRLAALDPDHAAELNAVGFSKFDNDFGHSLAEQIQRSGRLSDKQWGIAVRLAIRYRRQTGDPRDGN